MTEKSPILAMLKKLQALVEKMDQRERLLVFATGLTLVGSIWYLGLMQPLNKTIDNTRNEIETVRGRIETINQTLEVQALTASPSDIRNNIR